MRYMDIPGTGLKPSAIIIGAVCAVESDTKDAFRMLDIFREAGGNIIDSANVYGKWFPAGTNNCDENIGKWLKSRKCRDSFIVVSKGGHPPLDDFNKPRLNKNDVLYDLDESLKALDTDCIDLFFLHRDDINTPVEEIIGYLNEFIKSGKIRHIGCSNWNPERIKDAQIYAAKHGLQGFSVNQLLWSMADISLDKYPAPGCCKMDKTTYEYHKSSGLPAFAYSSQANGFFKKYIERDSKPVSDDLIAQYGSEDNLLKLSRAVLLSEKTGQPLSAIVLSYLTSRPFPTAAIIGPRNDEQLTDSLQAADLTLTADDISFIDIDIGV